jgi:plastocyanin
MRFRAFSSTLTALVLAAVAATPALAADATVNIPSRAVSFTPNTVTVGPNDSVTWVWTGPSNDRNHSPASNVQGTPESWDADPQITPFTAKPDFDHGAGHTFAKHFSNAKAGSYAYHCRVHADMTGTVVVSGAPVPALTVTPAAPFAGDQVTFDATSSTDPDGSIVKYEWDLDGNGTFESDTGTTPTVDHTYTSPASLTVKLRVTDDIGNVRDTSTALTVATRAPTASFTVGPNPAAKGAAVTFDATASSATAGRAIADYAWDLDGNGTFETDGGTTPTTSTTYAAAGALNVGLQVTDSAGDTATKTVSLTISNAPPTAAFTVSNATPASGATVSFDASGSTDPDGTIAHYQWDLDGNGTFETDTGTTPTTSRAYTATTTVKLQVVDNEGATTQVTQTVTVPTPPTSSTPPPSSSPPPAPPAAAPVAAPVATPPVATVATAPAPIIRPAPAPVATKPTVKAKKKATKKKKHKAKKKKRKSKRKKRKH